LGVSFPIQNGIRKRRKATNGLLVPHSRNRRGSEDEEY
jgi:hypothetical protein